MPSEEGLGEPVLSGNDAIALQQVADWHAEQATRSGDGAWHAVCAKTLRRVADNTLAMTLALRTALIT